MRLALTIHRRLRTSSAICTHLFLQTQRADIDLILLDNTDCSRVPISTPSSPAV